MARIGAEEIQVIQMSEPDHWEQRTVLGERTITGCAIWPRSSTEDGHRGMVLIEGLNVFIPPGETVAASDRIVARGEEFEVDGEPGLYRDKRGRDKGMWVALTKAGRA